MGRGEEEEEKGRRPLAKQRARRQSGEHQKDQRNRAGTGRGRVMQSGSDPWDDVLQVTHHES